MERKRDHDEVLRAGGQLYSPRPVNLRSARDIFVQGKYKERQELQQTRSRVTMVPGAPVTLRLLCSPLPPSLPPPSF
jgi:hypothetical protein